MTDLQGLLRALAAGEVEYILIGGAAGIAHGSARLTLDVDIVYRRTTAILDAFGVECRGLSLTTLIKAKRAAGRPKDFEAIAELEAIAEELQR